MSPILFLLLLVENNIVQATGSFGQPMREIGAYTRVWRTLIRFRKIRTSFFILRPSHDCVDFLGTMASPHSLLSPRSQLLKLPFLEGLVPSGLGKYIMVWQTNICAVISVHYLVEVRSL